MRLLKDFLEEELGPRTTGRVLAGFRHLEQNSQEEFAKGLNISLVHLCEIEEGRRAISAETAAQFVEALHLSKEIFHA